MMNRVKAMAFNQWQEWYLAAKYAELVTGGSDVAWTGAYVKDCELCKKDCVRWQCVVECLEREQKDAEDKFMVKAGNQTGPTARDRTKTAAHQTTSRLIRQGRPFIRCPLVPLRPKSFRGTPDEVHGGLAQLHFLHRGMAPR